MKQLSNPSKQKISMFEFLSLTALMVLTVYEYPTFATAKLHLVFFVIVFGIFWFLPIALVSAEMASVQGFEEGGVFGWVSHTLGERFGFSAIFFQWFQVTVSFVTMSYFILGALSTITHLPMINDNPWIKFLGVLIIYWGLTFMQFKGTKRTAKLSKSGFLWGILLPSIIFFILAIVYIVQGYPIQIEMNWHSLVPDFKEVSTLVVAASFILAFGGIEASASHINELDHPSKNYPLVIIILIILTIALDAIGGLSVAVVVPQKELSLSAGMIQAFQTLIGTFTNHGEWIVIIMGLLIIYGVIAEIASWIIGPSRGMYVAAHQGFLPVIFKKVNKDNVPVPLLIAQGMVVTIWDAILTFGSKNGNVSFLVAVSLTVVIYLLCYILIFVGYFVLVLHDASRPRTYQIPGGKIMKLLLATSGLLLSIFALIVSFLPPASLPVSDRLTYQIILAICFVIVAILPFIIYAMRHHFGQKTEDYHMHHVHVSDVNKFIRPIGRGEYLIENKTEK